MEIIGSIREAGFSLAEKFLSLNIGTIIETGCHRDRLDDGFSTLHFAKLAKLLKVSFHSFELEYDHIALAKQLILSNEAAMPMFHHGDSVANLSRFQDPVKLIYLDSMDVDFDHPEAPQRHQLAELGAIYGKLSPISAVLMDDNLPQGKRECGKPRLSELFLQDRGWIKVLDDYQLMYVRKNS